MKRSRMDRSRTARKRRSGVGCVGRFLLSFFLVSFTSSSHMVSINKENLDINIKLTAQSRTLATTPYLILHTPTPRAASSPTSLINPQTTPISSLPPTPHHSACTHHFLHPLSWMRPELELGNLSGRLECPNQKCKAQIGKYAWQGMRCSCGVWVCPAFSLLKGRCDEVTIRKRVEGGSSGAGGIRLPPGMRERGSTIAREKGSL
ncbi:hypothetical protein OCU04_011584 [Sclerotinia nivalis]|uniref:protein-tyrosine-phosphatase n=1 Tax=Sclerotinia nivalis TaxID=352851 RepID=A0A9X0ABU3_9HELO|nr:hypothetical protein OCU04_011584 [Sclerotinia nivalis]